MKILLLIAILVLIAICLGYAIRRRSIPYPSWLGVLLENRFVEKRIASRKLLDRAHISAGMKVLDVGCGAGRVTLPASERVGPEGEVVAMDIQAAMIRKLEARIRKKRLKNIQIILGRAGEGRISRNSFDRALLVTVLGEIQDKTRAMLEIHNALKLGGLLSVTEMQPDVHYLRRKTVRSLAEGVGFQFQESFGSFLGFTVNFVKTRDTAPKA